MLQYCTVLYELHAGSPPEPCGDPFALVAVLETETDRYTTVRQYKSTTVQQYNSETVQRYVIVAVLETKLQKVSTTNAQQSATGCQDVIDYRDP